MNASSAIHNIIYSECQNMSYSPWGAIQHKVSFFSGCTSVSTSSHGGIIVTEHALNNSPYFAQYKGYDFSEFSERNGTFSFEEDVDANIILAALPQAILAKHYHSCTTANGYETFKNNCLFALKSFRPELFKIITGKELSIFDSHVLFRDFLESKQDLTFLDGAFSGYNIPVGYVAVSVKKNNQVKKNEFFLIKRDIYERDIYMPVGRLGYLPIDPKLLDTPFVVDFWTPSSIPKDVEDNRFYVSHSRLKNNIRIVLAYNYQSQSKMCFEMSEDYYDNLSVGETGIVVDDNNVVDNVFISVSAISPLEYIN